MWDTLVRCWIRKPERLVRLDQAEAPRALTQVVPVADARRTSPGAPGGRAAVDDLAADVARSARRGHAPGPQPASPAPSRSAPPAPGRSPARTTIAALLGMARPPSARVRRPAAGPPDVMATLAARTAEQCLAHPLTPWERADVVHAAVLALLRLRDAATMSRLQAHQIGRLLQAFVARYGPIAWSLSLELVAIPGWRQRASDAALGDPTPNERRRLRQRIIERAEAMDALALTPAHGAEDVLLGGRLALAEDIERMARAGQLNASSSRLRGYCYACLGDLDAIAARGRQALFGGGDFAVHWQEALDAFRLRALRLFPNERAAIEACVGRAREHLLSAPPCQRTRARPRDPAAAHPRHGPHTG